MASSKYSTAQYTSDQFVESSGAILFDLSSEVKRVCLIHYIEKNEWLLPKGRRNCSESRQDAALREVEEETGYKCHLHPVRMSTRAPSAIETGDVPDQARTYPKITEPFILTMRELEKPSNVKLIWWYIAAVDENADEKASSAGCGFAAEFFTYAEAMQTLTYQDDRNVLERAIVLVEGP